MADRAALKGYLLVASAFVACPCHIPLWIGLVAGTAAGAFFLDNWTLVVPALLAYFVVALYLGNRVLKRAERARREAQEGVPARGP